MKIVIPMSGFGERFRQAGYTVPKPLIEVEGKPIIAHVIDMFPGEKDFLFICNQEHLDNPSYRMKEILNHYCPTGKIIGIAPHKLGPVYAVEQVFDELDPEEPTIVNYCDFTCYWDYHAFKRFVTESKCDGCIPAYRGFHPHSLGSTFYAYLKETQGKVTDIQEKKPFTDHPMQEYASSGTYYFSRGEWVKHYFRKTMQMQLQVNGEYYVSLVYKPMFEDNRLITVYEIEHFMQWGTPQDLAEYQQWSQIFRKLLNPQNEIRAISGTLMIPMAGLGSRFTQEGYDLPKPLIPVLGRPMVVQAASDLPAMEKQLFILRKDLPQGEEVISKIKKKFPQAEIQILDHVTEGQAKTCLLGMPQVDSEKPLIIGACDNGMIYDKERFYECMQDPKVDVIVFGARGYPGAKRSPHMYGWIQANENGVIEQISVKTPLKNPAHDPIVVGAFAFKRASDFEASANRMIKREGRINGEYYVDTCINDAIALGLRCVVFDIQHYLCWGTPNDLRTFKYWQSCFHKWQTHPYHKIPEDSDQTYALSSQ